MEQILLLNSIKNLQGIPRKFLYWPQPTVPGAIMDTST